MPITSEHAGLVFKRSTKAEPMVPEEPITMARKGLGSKLICGDFSADYSSAYAENYLLEQASD